MGEWYDCSGFVAFVKTESGEYVEINVMKPVTIDEDIEFDEPKMELMRSMCDAKENVLTLHMTDQSVKKMFRIIRQAQNRIMRKIRSAKRKKEQNRRNALKWGVIL